MAPRQRHQWMFGFATPGFLPAAAVLGGLDPAKATGHEPAGGPRRPGADPSPSITPADSLILEGSTSTAAGSRAALLTSVGRFNGQAPYKTGAHPWLSPSMRKGRKMSKPGQCVDRP